MLHYLLVLVLLSAQVTHQLFMPRLLLEDSSTVLPSVRSRVAAQWDDAVESVDGTVVNDGDALPLAEAGALTGVRFAAPIPERARVLSARLYFVADVVASGVTTVTIRIEDALVSGPLGVTPHNLSQRALASSTGSLAETVVWRVDEDWVAGERYVSPDVSTLLEALPVGQVEVVSFFFEGEGAARFVEAWDGGGRSELVATYNWVE